MQIMESEQTHPSGLVFEDSEHLDKTLESLNKLRKNGQFCDVTLQIISTGQDIHEVHAHRAVLASASPFLFDLFINDPHPRSKHVFRLEQNLNVEAFHRLVDYAYTARLEVPEEKVKEVYVAARFLKMNLASKHCADYLANHLSTANCIAVRCIPKLVSDPDLLARVDTYIQQHMYELTRSKELITLPQVQVELIQSSYEEIEATNEKHLCDMVLDWMKHSFDEENNFLGALTEKVHMLYLNLDHTLHDCNDIESGDLKDSEIIQDYKKMSRKVSQTPGTRGVRKPSHPAPAKPREFLYTKDEDENSDSSIISDDKKESLQWKVIATVLTKEHNVIGLAGVQDKLIVLSVVQRLHTPSKNSSSPPRNTSVERSDSYTMVPPMSTPRCAVGTAELKGKLVVCGGYDRGECLKTVEIYDISTNKWTILKPMRVPRGRFNIAVVNDKVYAIGGSDGTKELSSAEVLDSMNTDWKKMPNLPAERSNAGVCSLGDKIYVIGGWNGQRGINRCDVFDPNTQSWSTIGSLLVGRYQAGVAAMNTELYAVGGCDSWSCLSTVEKYSLDTDTWIMVASLHTARRGCGVAVYNGKLYAVGGHDGVHSLYSVEIYDPQTNIWSPGPPLTSCRANVGVSVVGSRLYAVGGFNGKTFLNTIEYLDAHSNEWTTFVPKENIPTSNNSGCNPDKMLSNSTQ